MKNFLKKALVVAIGAATVMSMSLVSFADTTPLTEAPNVNKTITYADGVTLPGDAVTITFTQKDNGAGQPVKVADVAIPAVTKDATNANFASGTKVDLGKIVVDNFANAKPGLYTYNVAETSPKAAANGYGWAVGGETYTLRVYKTTDGLSYTVENSKKEKVDSIDFTNKYTKTSTLEVSKTVTNKEYESESPYKFTITFTNDDKNAAVNKDTYTGKIGETEVTCKVGEATSFELQDGEKLVFSDVPAGTKYVVTEDGGKNFTATYQVTTDGKQAAATKVDQGKKLETGEQKLGSEGDNIVAVTNDYTPVTITGIITNSLPYVTMILIAIAGIALFVVGRRKFNR
ncbi:MAG: hypothetical protein PUB39_03110 [Eubacteriales bacterium]|nr:hypothetical protein [Eubacteriales bacterium]